jgi:hypothetical protein
VGYGILADCIACGVALLYPPRQGFREDEISLRECPRYLRMRELPPEDFHGGRWDEHLRSLLAQPTPPETFARIKTSHEMNRIDAIRGTQKTTSPFEYSAMLTEIMLLGVVALNAGKKIQYDGAGMRVTNVADSDALLKRVYREGWKPA